MDKHNRATRRATIAASRRKGLPVVGQEFSKRECGECSACCTHLAVDVEPVAHTQHNDCPALQPSGVDGRRLCGIYATRPKCCSDFQCLWLQGFEGPELRPDRCGFIMRVLPDGMVMFNAIREGAFEQGSVGWDAAVRAGSSAPTTTEDMDGSQRLYFPPAALKAVENGPTKA